MKISFYILLITFFTINILYAKENNYYLILKNNKVNVRYGPGFDYPIKFIYKKKIYLLKLLIKKKILEELLVLKITVVGFMLRN